MTKKVEEKLLELIKQHLTDIEYTEKKMFGGLGVFINRNMFTGFHQSTLFLRLAPEDREEALFQDGITVFEPRKRMVMSEYVVVTDSLLSDTNLLNKLFRKSIAYVSRLPPKEPKKTKQ